MAREEHSIDIIVQVVDKAQKQIKAIESTINRALPKLESEVARIAEVSQKAAPAIDEMNSSLARVANTAEKAWRALKIGAAAAAGIYAVKKAVDATVGSVISLAEAAGSFETLEVKIRMVSASTQEFQKNWAAVQQLAMTSSYSFETIAKAFAQLKATGIEATDRALRALMDAVAAFGGSTEDFKGAIEAISQMAGKGVVSMEELKQQLAERVPTAIKIMAKELGMSVPELTKKISQGAISAKEGIQALIRGFEKAYGGAAEVMANTYNTLKEKIADLWKVTKANLAKTTEVFAPVKAVLMTIRDLLVKFNKEIEKSPGKFKVLGEVVKDVFVGIIKGAAYVVEGFYRIKEAVLVVKSFFLALEEAWARFTRFFWRSVEKLLELVAKLKNIPGFGWIGEWADRQAFVVKAELSKFDAWLEDIKKRQLEVGNEGLKIGEKIEALWDAVNSVVKTYTENIKKAADTQKKAAEIAQKAAQATKDAQKENANAVQLTAKELEKYKSILDKITLASMPEHQRQIEAIRQKYEKLKEELKSIPEAAYKQLGLTKEQVQELLKKLDRQQQEEINKTLQKQVQYQETLVDKIKGLWSGVYEELAGVLEKWIEKGKVQLQDLLDYFRSFVARMVSYWLMGMAQMQFSGFMYVPGKGAVAASQASNVAGAVSPLSYFKVGLGNYYNLLTGSANIFGRLYYNTGWEPFYYAYDFFASPFGSAVGAGILSGAPVLIFTGDWKRATGAAIGGGIGFAVGGPVGGAVGGLIGSVAGGLFGHKKRKKPEFHILEDMGGYSVPVGEWLTWDESTLRSTFHFDMDHAKHEKEAEAKIVHAYKQTVDSIVKDWMDFTRQIDARFGTSWEEALKQYQITFFEHNWKGKHIGEDIEKYLKEGLPKEMLTQFVDFVAEQMKGYVADAEKFNQAIQSYKEAIQNASSQEELQQIYEQFKADIGTVLQMIDSVSNYMKYYLGETGQAVLGIIQQAEATWQTLEEAGLLTDELKQKIVEKAETDIALYLNQQLGLYKDWELQIARFKSLYGDVAQLIEQAGLSWRDLYNILIHVDQYMDVLQKIAEEHGITVEQLIAELAEYDVALKKQADAVREAAEASYSFASSLQGLVSSFARAGVFSPAESSYGMAWILAQELAAAMQLLPEGQPHSWAEFGVADPVRWLQEHMNAQTVKAVFDWLVSVYGDVTKIPSIWFDVLQQWSDYIANMQEEQKRAAEEQRRQAEEATKKAEEERKRYLQELKRLYEDTRRELERWADVIKKVDQTILDVAGYGLTPPATFRLLQYQYQQLYAKALSGDPEAIQKFLSFTRTYMQAGLKMAATPEEVAKLKEKVLKDLWKIRRVAENRYEDIKKKLDDINSKLNNLNSINTTLSSMNTTMSYMYSNMYDMNTTISYMSDTQMTEMNDTLSDINENIKNIDTSGMADLMSYIMWGVNAEEAVNQQFYLTKNLEKLIWSVSETLSYLTWGVSAEESANQQLYLTSNLTTFLSSIKSLLEDIKSFLDTIKSKVSDISDYIVYGFTYNINNTYAIAEELATGLDIPMSPYANHLETGGIVDDPTLALIGEGDRAEAVIPLPFGPKTMDILFDELREMKAENRALLIENRRLRKELYRLNYEMLKESKKTNRVLGKWDAIGMPPQQPQPKQEEVSA